MKDYLSAIDDVAKEPYVDKDRLGCIGASYGGYSVFIWLPDMKADLSHLFPTMAFSTGDPCMAPPKNYSL
jgi:dienelactone hydrolase